MNLTDQMNRHIILKHHPKKIISLVPSQTELLATLNLEKEVIGITKFCIHPPNWLKTKTIVGGPKQVNLEKIELLEPDLIIANKEENNKQDIELLQEKYPIWVSDINTLSASLEMIRNLGKITDREVIAVDLIQNIKQKFNKYRESFTKRLSVLYMIWKTPYMCAGKNTIIDHFLEYCGLENVTNTSRYPTITENEIKSLKPDLIFLSSEPYPFQEKHKAEFQALCPSSKILLTDGEMFSWYGSRLQYSPEYFYKLIQTL